MSDFDILVRVREQLSGRIASATSSEITLGPRVVAVAVEDPTDGRLVGLAHRPRGGSDEGDFESRSVTDLAAGATDADSRLTRSVGIATLNALSTPEIPWRVGDPMAALPATANVVATVGLFRPAFRKFSDVTVRVVERNPPTPESVESPDGVAVETYAPEECAAAFDGADVCFLTGSTLVYGGVERYLAELSRAGVSPVVLVGATASHLPGPAFNAGVDVVAGARVSDPDRTLERVAAGDCGTDLHDEGVEKVYVANDGSGLELAADGEKRTEQV